MRRKIFATVALVVAPLTIAPSAYPQELLTGDTRLACEAILCLSSAIRPGACTPSLDRYFSIAYRWWSDTVQARFNFLELCPTSNQSPEMQSLIGAIAKGAGRCDVSSLNVMLSWPTNADCYNCPVYISNQLPSYCGTYYSHPFTNFSDSLPRYVGSPWRGGYWVEARDYDRLSSEYNARLKAEEEAKAAEEDRVNERNMWW